MLPFRLFQNVSSGDSTSRQKEILGASVCSDLSILCLLYPHTSSPSFSAAGVTSLDAEVFSIRFLLVRALSLFGEQIKLRSGCLWLSLFRAPLDELTLEYAQSSSLLLNMHKIVEDLLCVQGHTRGIDGSTMHYPLMIVHAGVF